MLCPPQIVGTKSPELVEFFGRVDKAGGDLRAVWQRDEKRNKKMPCTWGNAQRQYKAWCAAAAVVAAAAAPAATPAAAHRPSAGPSGESRTAPAAGRTTRPSGQKTRRTSVLRLAHRMM